MTARVAPDPVARSHEAWWRHLGRRDDPASVRRRLAAGSIAAAAAATARRAPAAEALRVGGERVTHGQLDDEARRLAAWLRQRGAGPGACVLLAGGNSLAYVTAYLGILHAGAAVSPVNPMLTATEVTALVGDTAPVAAVAEGAQLEHLRATGAPAHLLDLRGEGAGTLRGAVAASAAMPPRPPEPAEIAHLASTSGTTGRPKQAPLSHGNLLASIRSLLWAWRWSEGDVLVHALPLQHGHGLSAVQAVLLTGCRSAVLPSFDPEELCATIERERGTVLFGVPAMYERLLATGALARADLSSLRLATTGSAAMSPRTYGAVEEILGELPVERYGCTESGYVLSNLYAGERRAGWVGCAVPGAEVAVVDPGGAPVPDGEDGEIVVRGPQVFSGYGGAAAGDPGAFLPGGWFRTGDIGRADAGFVAVTGRAKEMIISGGLNVYPREVEIALEAVAGVAAVAVVGAPSERWGEEVTAFVVPSAGGLDTAALDEHAARVLAPYKRPKRYLVVDALPTNHMGKVLRSTLASWAVDPQA